MKPKVIMSLPSTTDPGSKAASLPEEASHLQRGRWKPCQQKASWGALLSPGYDGATPVGLDEQNIELGPDCS